ARFYIVESWLGAPLRDHFILQVEPEGSGSLVRDIRVRPGETLVNVVVESVNVSLPDVSPADLSEGFGLCSANPGEIDRELKSRTRSIAESDDAGRVGIVATCGDHEVVLHFPHRGFVNLKGDTEETRQLARWWEFRRTVEERVLGRPHPASHSNGCGLPDALDEIQRHGEAAARDVGAGMFDKGFDPELPWGGARPLHDYVKDYAGPLAGRSEGRLREHYRFQHYVAPGYPIGAFNATLGGVVRLELDVDPRSGDVLKVTVLQGNPLLAGAVVAAARQWKFALEGMPVGKVPATVDFSFVWRPADAGAIGSHEDLQ